MNTETEALARRIMAACPDPWMPGMRTDDGLLVASVSGTGWLRTVRSLDFRPPGGGLPVSVGECAASTKIPDLDDPATLGCLEFAIVPRAFGETRPLPWLAQYTGCLPYRLGLPGRRGHSREDAGGHSRVESLVVALERAAEWKREGWAPS
jgi:hypothetical protein